MKQYNLFRIDDVCDKMPNHENVIKLINLLNKYHIRPLIGVIPEVKDDSIINENSTFKLEDLVDLIENNKIIVALHGRNHKYHYTNKGILKLNKISEFSGINMGVQEKMIKSGINILNKRLQIIPKYFFAPSHNYDENTLKILKKYSLINVDGISLYPFYYKGVYHIPQQKRTLQPKLNFFKNGIFVNHFHPKDITNKKLQEINEFCLKNRNSLINFENVHKLKIKRNKVLDALFVCFYYFKLYLYRFLHNT